MQCTCGKTPTETVTTAVQYEADGPWFPLSTMCLEHLKTEAQRQSYKRFMHRTGDRTYRLTYSDGRVVHLGYK